MSFVSIPFPSALFIWWHAIRPRTLSMSIVPVLTGGVLAWTEAGRFALLPLLAALVGALGIQAGTNLLNDASDGESGLDRPARLGPPRVTAEGWASAAQVKRAAALSFCVAAIAGLVAIAWGGLPILAVGVASLVAGWAYSRGPAPISAGPLGEFFVLIFFGVVAVAGTYFLIAGAASAIAFSTGILVGLPAAAVLLVNNHRDRVGDALSGRRTLAIRLGIDTTRHVFGAMLGATIVTALAMAMAAMRPALALPLLAAPLAVALANDMRAPIGGDLNALLGRTARFQAVCAALFAIGLFLSP